MFKLFDKRKGSTRRQDESDESSRDAEATPMNDSNMAGHAVDGTNSVSDGDSTRLHQSTPTTTLANGSSNSVPALQIKSNGSALLDEEAGKTGMRSGIDNYGAITTPNNPQHEGHQLLGLHLEVSEESSDASSQYSSKMDYLTPEDRRAGNDAERYLAQTMFHRAYPERSLALFVTLLLELPTLFIISGGSDQLCSLIGRRRYQLLVAFLPLTSAISGNVGLQASTLTTRAVSHLHVTKHSYCSWLITEVGTAGYQGLGMGSVSGLFAYIASGQDFAFGITIFLAQFISILTAGFTGTLAPLIFTFVFQRDSGQWGGPLETAIQDIVGSFAMVVLSYHVLNWLGPHDIHESDVC